MSYTQLRQTVAEGLVTAYQIPEEDIAAILPEKEEDFKADEFKQKFLDLDKERIQTINMKGKDKFDQGYGKAKKEERTAYESEIREAFGIEDADLQGIDLVNKVVEINSKKSKGDATKLTEEELKAHPAVISILNQKDKAWKEKEEELKKDYETKITSFQKEQVFGKFSKKALDILDSMNPVLSSDPVRASNQKNILIEKLKQYDYQEEGDNKFTPLAEGKRLEDAHGHGITDEKLVKDIATKYFDFKKSEDRDNPPPGGDDGSGGSTKTPASEAEYVKTMSDRSIPFEERKQIKEAWDKKQAAS